ncbi:DISARM system phospholipase D-like protein DrmC [Polynucleobacter sp. MWH-Tro8-2-5-gr]|uniref:DISARM system phospholipase D-like protein DrmC n=1 Tax=Polynucleobacter sp. MWH-Tro8-2-5-gr TaxID=1855606 RepID=UPI001F3E8B03|nr:DISARM system phospholipase D-like protein DrmC [Polynucleobacter sp. MWH-Tro8-2-5-gr]
MSMDRMLELVSALAAQIPFDKAQAIASKIRALESKDSAASVLSLISAPKALELLNEVIREWRLRNISAIELSAMLIASSYTQSKITNESSVELVWTGPTSRFVAPRRTEQALLQVINSAQKELFITSFVAYNVQSIVNALNAVCDKGITLTMLLESSHEDGGSIGMDVIARMKKLIPLARVYAWKEKSGEFENGRVHAKVAVADRTSCFITSANLTGYAMEKNMELGLLIEGGEVPSLIMDHLQALVATKVLSLV